MYIVVLDKNTWNYLTMCRLSKLRVYKQIVCVKKKKGERGRASTENCIDASIQKLDYIRKCRGRLITSTRNNTENTTINRIKITKKQKWE